MPKLTRIAIHPFKSCDPQSVDEAVLLASGALAHDRRFALRDLAGEVLNAKRSLAFNRLRTHFDPSDNRLTLRSEGSDEVRTFDVLRQRRELAQWLTDYFGMTVEIVEDPAAGFPDDTDSPGPTLTSTGTMAAVGAWFGGLALAEVRRRFRANLEIDALEPFWEDRLVAEGSGVVRFRIGEAVLLGTNPCQRCPVPSRDPTSGVPIREFGKTFSRHRQETLPVWAPRSRFDHFYRLAVNTRPAEHKQRTIRVGDEVEILGAE